MSDFESGIGGIVAAEPLKNTANPQVHWSIDNIRFHYPAEHTINGTQYDLEMQIFGSDLARQSILCNGKGAVSIFFQIDTEEEGNSFFDWQADAAAGRDVSIDLSSILPKTAEVTNNIYGYSGTDTMPGCENVCWYVIETPQTISKAQHDFFKLPGKDSNARA